MSRRRKQHISRILIIALIVVGVVGLGFIATYAWKYYQKTYVVDPYTFDPNHFDELKENEVKATVKVQLPTNVCPSPRVFSTLDSGSYDQSTLSARGREADNDGTYLTVMSTTEPTMLSVYDNSGMLCASGNYTYSGTAPVVITIENAAQSFNPFADDPVLQISSQTLTSLPSYNQFTTFMKTRLATQTQAEVIASTEYQALITQLITEISQLEATQ